MIEISILKFWATISCSILGTAIFLTGCLVFGDYRKRKRIQNIDRLKAINTLECFQVEHNKDLEDAIDLAIEILKNEEMGS